MQVGTINRKLKGWSNYFRIGTVSKAYRTVDSHVRHQGTSVVVREVQGTGSGGDNTVPRINTCTRSWDYTSLQRA